MEQLPRIDDTGLWVDNNGDGWWIHEHPSEHGWPPASIPTIAADRHLYRSSCPCRFCRVSEAILTD